MYEFLTENTLVDDGHDRQTPLFKSGNIKKTEGGQILPHLCNSLIISMKFDLHENA